MSLSCSATQHLLTHAHVLLRIAMSVAKGVLSDMGVEPDMLVSASQCP